ncbi:precorrin-6y C5,15-methyltransferase (decarboxylating) subunit CbiE [Oscillatoria salina]|uniref:precorrin-6y C5,15-methyltransferase (decarboxylating) subunit CbiE n=1 Tax=Oscillatoria salina TaxID=331517 RepID=UPI0013B9173C|nr:precorrin-6y C5,15-methyltransferase (decarboxylating) subunit CbiE [Oscillatoria salina]MBZ8179964.1 precorrin-6y C5,15-methyltransferase (decarboxylating) subunit CbiE [Oscillatoria salina IIICB1]NET86811.1 precorrin-6y C5,15-methyltransferase (decarboxylating) subunit CbiE [Kamptonema sp. SIO1D9]
MSEINVVGIGLDGAAGLTESVREIVERATLLVGSDRHLTYFPQHPALRLVLGNFTTAITEIRQRLDNSDSIVILVSGDPLFFGLGRLLLSKLPPEKLHFHPHLSSVQLAFNRLKVPWQDAKIISAHGRSLDELSKALQQGIDKIAILTDGKNTPGAIANLYLALDLPTSYDFWVCENLGATEENVNCYSPETLERKTFAKLNVVVLIKGELTAQNELNVKELPLIGLPDRTFLSLRDRPGLMTKREVRLVILGELALKCGQTVWDIGAGTGSVAIEIARLCPNSQVYAIEKTAMGKALIEQNCQRLQVNNVYSLHGIAPKILTDLPAPNRIFIGGSGGNLESILDFCATKLLTEGILVLALATLEHLNLTLNWLQNRNWNYRILQLNIARSTPVAQLTRFSPLNPVTIVNASQK